MEKNGKLLTAVFLIDTQVLIEAWQSMYRMHNNQKKKENI